MTLNTDRSAHSARTLKYGTNVVIASVLFLVVLGALNYFATSFRWRLDMTATKEFTVSEATKKLLGKLKDKATVTVYATEQDTPPDWSEQRNQLRDLLYEYRLLSGNKVQYKFLDPSNDKIKQEAEEKGIREQPMQKVSTTEVSVKVGYLGMIVQYSGKSEVIPVIVPQSSLEYQVTRAINKVAEVDIPTIGIIAPGGNPYMGEAGNFQVVSQFLEQEGYKTKTLEPTRLNDLKDCRMLMVFEPEELSEEALYRIDQFVMNGGKLFVAASGVQIDQRSGRAMSRPPNINSILEFYGMRVDSDLLEDWGRGFETTMLTPRGVVRMRNPFAMEVADLSRTSLITQKLPRMVTVYPSSVSGSAHGTSGTVEVIARTSARTKKQEQMFVLQPDKVRQPPNDEGLQAYNLIMSVKGTLDSRYGTVDPPVITEDGGTTRAVSVSEVKKTSDPSAAVVVAGSAFSFYDEVMGRQDGQLNGIFLVNVADALTRSGEMIGLRSKKTQIASLKDKIEQSEAKVAEALAIGAVPILLILFGIGKVYMNRMKRARYVEMYGSAD
jgi:ABC-2 type transport system permease protein